VAESKRGSAAGATCRGLVHSATKMHSTPVCPPTVGRATAGVSMAIPGWQGRRSRGLRPWAGGGREPLMRTGLPADRGKHVHEHPVVVQQKNLAERRG
jgi:hypothetical protein